MSKLKKVLIIISALVIFIIAIIVSFYVSKKNNDELEDEEFSDEIGKTDNEIYNKDKQKVYSVKDKKFYWSQTFYDNENENSEYRGTVLLEYDNSNKEYAEIYYIFYDYTTDPTFYYTLEVKDEANSSLLISEEEYQDAECGTEAIVRIKKVSLYNNNIIKFSMFERNKETNEVINNSQIKINLEKDLEEKVKIDQSDDLEDGSLGDINFKYIDSRNVYFGTTEHTYSKNLVGENASLPIKVQYGNHLVSEEHIEFWYDKNVNNLTLEEAFKYLSLINETFGQYGLSDIYGMDVTDNQGEIIDTIIITFEDMLKLCKGLSIEKNGKEYTKNSFDGFAEITMVKENHVTIGDGINAIKYYFNTIGSRDKEYYMFIYKDKIYNIAVPMNERVNDGIQDFLDSLIEV